MECHCLIEHHGWRCDEKTKHTPGIATINREIRGIHGQTFSTRYFKLTTASTLVVPAKLFAQLGRAHHHYTKKSRFITNKTFQNFHMTTILGGLLLCQSLDNTGSNIRILESSIRNAAAWRLDFQERLANSLPMKRYESSALGFKLEVQDF